MSSFDFFDTPDPRERGFVLTVKENDKDVLIPDFVGQRVLYSDLATAEYRWITHNGTVRSEFAGYRLIHAAKAGPMQRAFYFAKAKTPEERAKPFRERTVKRMWAWPTVLYQLWFEEGLLPLSAVDEIGNIESVRRVHPRIKYRPGDQYPTVFRIRHYLSDEPFPAAKNQIVPITDSIQWSFDGSNGSFPECLHPGCTFPTYQTSGVVVPNAGTLNRELASSTRRQEFPPTAMQDWEKYVIEDTRRDVIPGGLMEERIVVEALPPIDDRENQT